MEKLGPSADAIMDYIGEPRLLLFDPEIIDLGPKTPRAAVTCELSLYKH